MKIKRVTLRNFQSHKHTTLRLHPGVNAFVGSSDVGKTAILRALRWVFHNEPSGADFRSHWSDKEATRVIVELRDGTEIERIKTKSRNSYLIRHNGKQQEYKSFKTAVPESVSALLPLGDLNWQQQMEPAFALSSSPAELGRALNEVARLDEIDDSLTNINAFVRNTEREKNILEEQHKDVVEQLKRFDRLTACEKRFRKHAVPLREEMEKLELQTEHLSRYIRLYREALSHTKQAKHQKRIALRIHRCLTLHAEEIVPREEAIERLLKYVKLCYYLKHAQRTARFALEEWKNEMPETCPLCGRGE